MKTTLFALLALMAIVTLVITQRADASAPSGNPAIAYTASTTNVSTAAKSVFGTSTACTARIIGTASSSIMITFSQVNGLKPSGFVGYTQAASTTKEYDSGIYGCDAMWIYSYTPQLISVQESQ